MIKWIVQIELDRHEDLAKLLGFLADFPELRFTVEATEPRRIAPRRIAPLDPDELPYYWGSVGC